MSCQPPASLNGTDAPDAAGAVEVHQPSGAVARRLLNDEVSIQRKSLPHRQDIFVAVQVSPARLHHTQFRIMHERRDGLAQKIGIGSEVGIEDSDHFNILQQR